MKLAGNPDCVARWGEDARGPHEGDEPMVWATTELGVFHAGQAALRDAGDSSDEALMERLRSSVDEPAFEELVYRYQQELCGYLRRYLGNAEMAEDVCQDTFLRVHLHRDSFTEGKRFRPWLYAIATHQAIDACRSSRRHRMQHLDVVLGGGCNDATLLDLCAGSDETATEQAERTETREWVTAAVAALPEPMQAPLNLVYIRGLKYREVAEELGLPLGTVKSRLHAALHKLNQSWTASEVK